MKQAVIWGIILGLCAFAANILLPGCIEPFADMLAAFIAGIVVIKNTHPENRGMAARMGLTTGLVVGIIISVTDTLTAGLLVAGYVYKDQLPWINLPDLSFLNSIFGNTLLVFLAFFLCMGVVKLIMTLMGGALGGLFLHRIPAAAQK